MFPRQCRRTRLSAASPMHPPLDFQWSWAVAGRSSQRALTEKDTTAPTISASRPNGVHRALENRPDVTPMQPRLRLDNAEQPGRGPVWMLPWRGTIPPYPLRVQAAGSGKTIRRRAGRSGAIAATRPRRQIVRFHAACRHRAVAATAPAASANRYRRSSARARTAQHIDRRGATAMERSSGLSLVHAARATCRMCRACEANCHGCAFDRGGMTRARLQSAHELRNRTDGTEDA